MIRIFIFFSTKMNWGYDFFLIWLIWILLVFSAIVGVRRMIKIIIWNYILIWIALALHTGIDFISMLLETHNLSYINNQEDLKTMLDEYKKWIILAVYLLFLILIFTKSKIDIGVGENRMIKIIIWIIFTPLTVISVIKSLCIVIFGVDVIETEKLQEFANEFEDESLVYYFLMFMPLWIILPAVMALFFSTEIKLRRKNNQNQENNSQE